jgi:hypothetical protein
MEKLKINFNYAAFLITLIILAIAGGCVTKPTVSPLLITPDNSSANSTHNQPYQDVISTSQPPVTLTMLVPGSIYDSGSVCNTPATAPLVPVPVDASIPIRDPMPGIKYVLNESDSDRTLVLGKGDIFEITLGRATSQPFHWIIPVSGCGLELLNDGEYSDGGDYWNNTGHYRARYRAVSPGRSILDGKLVLKPEEVGNLKFNLTVIVK